VPFDIVNANMHHTSMPSKHKYSVSVSGEVYERMVAASYDRGVSMAALVEAACVELVVPRPRMTFEDALVIVRARYPTATCRPKCVRQTQTFHITRGANRMTNEVPLGSGKTRAEAWKAAAMTVIAERAS